MDLVESVEEQVERLRRRDRIRTRILGAVLVLAAVAGLWGGKVISDLNSLLNRRTPLYVFLQKEARRQECLDDLEFANTIAFGNAALAEQANGDERLPPDHPTLTAYREATADLEDTEKICPPVDLPSE